MAQSGRVGFTQFVYFRVFDGSIHPEVRFEILQYAVSLRIHFRISLIDGEIARSG